MSSHGDNSHDQSDASTTMSEFVRRRYDREVPIFGGNPRVGAAELASAVTQSLYSTGIVDVLTNLDKSIRSSPVLGSGGFQRSDTVRAPITMINRDAEMLDKAHELDSAKVRMLLETSLVNSDDINKYYNIIDLAKDSMAKKAANTKLNAERRQAAVRKDAHVLDEEIYDVFETSDAAQRALSRLRAVGVPMSPGTQQEQNALDTVVLRALVHDSMFSGRCTNRRLALLGDAVLRLMLIQRYTEYGIAVGDISSQVQATQNNVALRDVGVRAGLKPLMKATPAVDPESRKVMATTVEALYGAVFMKLGMAGVFAMNDATKMQVVDFTRLEQDHLFGSEEI